MNKELEGSNKIRFAQFFSERSAYWENFGLGFIITLIMYLSISKSVKSMFVLLITLSIVFCFGSYYHYRHKEIDTVIRKKDKK